MWCRSSGSVSTGASVGKMLDHIALLRAIKKKKKLSRPTDPASRRTSMDKQTIFFYWPDVVTILLPASSTSCWLQNVVSVSP